MAEATEPTSVSPPPPAAENAPAQTDDCGWVVIMGKTHAGGKFRPSDWCDRLHGALRALDEEEAEICADFVRLVNYDGSKAVMIDLQLEEANGRLFQFFVNFARDNDLQTARIRREEWAGAGAG